MARVRSTRFTVVGEDAAKAVARALQ